VTISRAAFKNVFPEGMIPARAPATEARKIPFEFFGKIAD
jgi:hypothetical protein